MTLVIIWLSLQMAVWILGITQNIMVVRRYKDNRELMKEKTRKIWRQNYQIGAIIMAVMVLIYLIFMR